MMKTHYIRFGSRMLGIVFIAAALVCLVDGDFLAGGFLAVAGAALSI
jgi:hypothetical protein